MMSVPVWFGFQHFYCISDLDKVCSNMVSDKSELMSTDETPTYDVITRTTCRGAFSSGNIPVRTAEHS